MYIHVYIIHMYMCKCTYIYTCTLGCRDGVLPKRKDAVRVSPYIYIYKLETSFTHFADLG